MFTTPLQKALEVYRHKKRILIGSEREVNHFLSYIVFVIIWIGL